jgi:hypothetical protein
MTAISREISVDVIRADRDLEIPKQDDLVFFALIRRRSYAHSPRHIFRSDKLDFLCSSDHTLQTELRILVETKDYRLLNLIVRDPIL